jgi:hypothetical protein
MAKFISLKTASAPPQPNTLLEEYRGGRRFDVFRFGERHLFFRQKLTIHYIAYEEIDRFFRRVLAVPVRLACCSGAMELEHLVLCDGERELATILLRDPRSAVPLVDEIRALAPNAVFSKAQSGEVARA